MINTVDSRAVEASRSCPLVSIITPAYNASKYLPDLLESVRRQTWPRIEHIVIDDGSTDEGATRSILEEAGDLVWKTQPNAGQSATINQGIAMASGEVITIISADDYYACDEAVEKAVEHLMKCGDEVDGVYGRTVHVDEAGDVLAYQPPHVWPRLLLPYVFTISHCSLFVRRSAVVKCGVYWNEGLKYVADAEWILSLIESGVNLRRCSFPVAKYRTHGQQLSAEPHNPVRLREHREFDCKHGVNPAVDFLIRGALSVHRRLKRFLA